MRRFLSPRRVRDLRLGRRIGGRTTERNGGDAFQTDTLVVCTLRADVRGFNGGDLKITVALDFSRQLTEERAILRYFSSGRLEWSARLTDCLGQQPAHSFGDKSKEITERL